MDLSHENIHYATLLAQDFGMDSVQFIQSDVLKLRDVHEGAYDIVLTSDGAIGWLPDLVTMGADHRSFSETRRESSSFMTPILL